MNEVERHEFELIAIRKRVETLEAKLSHLGPSDASEVLSALKLTALPNDPQSRGACARQLHDAGWSYSRIARGMSVCEKTVIRWCQGV